MQRLQAKTRTNKAIILEDQTLREAFQVHPRAVSLDSRASLLRLLAEAGLKRVQVGSLARPDLMPQMAHTESLLEIAADFPHLEPWVLLFNCRGLQRATRAGFRHVAISASLSEIHSRRNLGCTVAQGLTRCRDLAGEALAQGMNVRMGLQCAFGGPMFPPPEPRRVLELFLPFKEIGVRRLALCDTAGRAKPGGLSGVLALLGRELPEVDLGLHLHGRPEQLSANLEAAWLGGADWLDVSLNGRGGCPFLPGIPPANLATFSAIDFMAQKGFASDLDINKLLTASVILERTLEPNGISTA